MLMENIASTATKLDCFVLSPIGDDGSPVREHADRVYHEIIVPGLEQFGFNLHRIDKHVTHPGASIPASIVEHLRSAPLCVALLTYLNPNVMFEVGVRQAWDLPIIHLASRDTILPFDVRSRDTVFYLIEDEQDVANAQQKIGKRARTILERMANAPAGVVPVVSEVFGKAMRILGRRYSLDAVFAGKRDAMQFACAQLRQIRTLIASDFEQGRPNAHPLKHHVDSVESLSSDLRSKVYVFESLASSLNKNDGPRVRCEPLLKRMKSLQWDLDKLTKHLRNVGSSASDFDQAELIIDDIIDKAESIRTDCVPGV